MSRKKAKTRGKN